MCVGTAGGLFEDAWSTGDVTFCATYVLSVPREKERELFTTINGKFDRVGTAIYRYQCVTAVISDYWLSVM